MSRSATLMNGMGEVGGRMMGFSNFLFWVSVSVKILGYKQGKTCNDTVPSVIDDLQNNRVTLL